MNTHITIHQDLEFSFEAAALPGAFSVLAFEADDALFECYEVRIDLASMDDNIDLTQLVDTEASLKLRDKYDQPRYFYGVIAEAEAGDVGVHRSFYSVVLRPALHRLNYVSDARIFQDESVPDIVALLLRENHVNDTEWRLAETHLPREFCVQYNETTYDFIRRLLAEEGIAFWFEHAKDGAKLVLSDAPLAMPTLEHAPAITYNAKPGGSDTRTSSIKSFRQTQRVRATDLHAKDYTFKRPAYGQDQKTRAQENAGEKSSYALYNYPGRYKQEGAGKPFTKYALEAERVSANQGQGVTDNIHLSSGHLFTLEDHPNAALNIMHRIVTTTHHGTQYAALEEDAPEGDENATRYEASFTTMPQRLPYRPVNPNPKPQIYGSQIAIVTGPAGEEIYTDEHGRVKIHFPWDRHNAKDENSSCWVRVSQNWAGGSWGHVAIPRIGQEVIVDYLDGDPDQPIIVGRTYHATNKPVYPLPSHKTKMVIRSQTHKGDGFNELSFEDERGQEKVYMHAEKDHEIHVENNRAKRVDRNQVESVGNNKSIQVGNNHHEIIGGNMTLMVGPNRLQSMITGAFKKMTNSLGDMANKLGLPDALNMGEGNLVIGVAKNKAETVMLSSTEIVGAGKAITVGGGFQTVVGGIQNTTVGIGAYEEVGQNKMTVVGKQYEIVCGESKIMLKEDGTIIFSGKKIFVQGDEQVRVVGKSVDIN